MKLHLVLKHLHLSQTGKVYCMIYFINYGFAVIIRLFNVKLLTFQDGNNDKKLVCLRSHDYIWRGTFRLLQTMKTLLPLSLIHNVIVDITLKHTAKTVYLEANCPLEQTAALLSSFGATHFVSEAEVMTETLKCSSPSAGKRWNSRVRMHQY